MSILEVKDLHANIHNHEILKGVNLTVKAGEMHSIMGPNGSGKSTLAQVLARREAYEVTRGQVLLNGKDLLAMKPEEAACEGLFMAFQYPVEIPGISNAYFLRAALNAIRKYRGEEELDAMDFLPLLKEKMRLLEMDERFLNRPVNEGFSGGEKKRNDIVPDYVHVLVDGRIVKSGGKELALELEAKGYASTEPASAAAR
jgi:Fe-S cluster assembly ATP-binding protein